MNLGNAYVQVGRVEESIRVFQNALQANPQLEGARRGLARAQARVGAGGRVPTP
jgi:predicted Zn-dependent protease